MELTDFLFKRTERFKKIAEFLAAINVCTITEKTDRRKNRFGKQMYLVFTPESGEKLEVDRCYVDELDFDTNMNRLWGLVEIIENHFGYSLIVSKTEYTWVTNYGSLTVSNDKFYATPRIEIIFQACIRIIDLIYFK